MTIHHLGATEVCSETSVLGIAPGTEVDQGVDFGGTLMIEHTSRTLPAPHNRHTRAQLESLVKLGKRVDDGKL